MKRLDHELRPAWSSAAASAGIWLHPARVDGCSVGSYEQEPTTGGDSPRKVMSTPIAGVRFEHSQKAIGDQPHDGSVADHTEHSRQGFKGRAENVDGFR
jgi:hypothetical protein